MKEYKVLTQEDGSFSFWGDSTGKFDPYKLESAINAYASQGWRVVSMATASFPAFSRGEPREEVLILFERDK